MFSVVRPGAEQLGTSPAVALESVVRLYELPAVMATVHPVHNKRSEGTQQDEHRGPHHHMNGHRLGGRTPLEVPPYIKCIVLI